MAQTDYSIANSSGAVFRARVNEVNAATKSSNSGPTAPSDPVAGMLWFDTSVSPPVLRQRNGANDGWVSIYLPAGGTTGQVLAKASATSFDAEWADIPEPDIPELSEAQVTDPDDTTFGMVSGQRISQAVAEFETPGSVAAWVNFDGTGTVAIRASKNVSSITDNGEGDYTINFATPLADANYAAAAMGNTFSSTDIGAGRDVKIATTSTTGTPILKTANAVRILSGTPGVADFSEISVTIFR